MPRKHLERSDRLPYHVTARSNNRENFPLPLDRMWEIVGFECLVLSTTYAAEIHALVLMPNHIHLLVTVPKHDLGLCMNVLMRSITQAAHRLSGRSGRLFGDSCYRSLIKETRYYRHALKYVYRNPTKAGLCERVEDYAYSTLHGLLGRSHLPFPVFQTRVGMEACLPAIEPSKQLQWLNTPFPAKAEQLIRRGFRKSVFLDLVDRDTRRPFSLLDRIL